MSATIVTYRLAYLDRDVDLCDACVERDDHDCGSLGSVQHGARPGECEGAAHGVHESAARYFRDGSLWVAVLRGMPQDSVRLGCGETRAEAVSDLQATPIQSTGPDGGIAAAIRWAQHAGWITADCEEVRQ